MSKSTKRHSCGNGEGMFPDENGYWVSYEEYKKVLSKYKKLKRNINILYGKSR
tara:strand:+ start:1869 stop:2027 length:159 start_codon:yes stop_codon:yes gene_type:complete